MARNFLKLSEFNALNLAVGEYNNKNITAAKETAEKVAIFYPCEVLINVSEYDNAKHFEYATIRLKHDTLPLTISYSDYTKKFSIGCEFSSLKNIDQHSVQSESRKFTEPNKIGVLNDKKILAWINYYESIYNNLKTKNDINERKIADFLESIKGLEVSWYGDNNKNGEIIKNGIRLSFTIGIEYVSQKIELYYGVPSSLASFKQLSDNKYKDATAKSNS